MDKDLELEGEIEVGGSSQDLGVGKQSQGDGQQREEKGEQGDGEQGGQEGEQGQGEKEQQRQGNGDEQEREQQKEQEQEQEQESQEAEEYPICLILRNGEFKGMFGEVTGEDEVSLIGMFGFLNLKKEEYALVGDVVDYKYVTRELKLEVLYGEIISFPKKKEIISGLNEITIVNNSDGTLHKVKSKDVICLHIDGEEPEMPPQEKVQSKVLNFIWKLRESTWKFERYIVGTDTHIALTTLFAMAELEQDNVWYIKPEYVSEKLMELDEKLLKAYILAIKNNPSYVTKNGYEKYFFNKIGSFLNSLILQNKNAFIANITIAPIGENEVILFNGVRIVVQEDSLNILAKDIDFAILTLNIVSNKVNNQSGEIIYGDINSEITEENILKPMRGFVNLVS